MIRFRETISEARRPAIAGRPCQDNFNRSLCADRGPSASGAKLKGGKKMTTLERMTDVMLELGFAGQSCDESMLRLRNFSDAEIARYSARAAEQARRRAVRRIEA